VALLPGCFVYPSILRILSSGTFVNFHSSRPHAREYELFIVTAVRTLNFNIAGIVL
jgi:hypothetical protein